MKWGSSAALRNAVTIAVTCLFVLSMWNCRSLKTTASHISATTDSLVELREIRTQVLNVPLSRADLRLELQEIKNLTPGAVFTGRNGQAEVRVERHDSLIYITATCDSLQLLAESQNREIYRLRSLFDEQTIRKPPSRWESFKNNAFYTSAGMALMLLIILILKLWKKKQIPLR